MGASGDGRGLGVVLQGLSGFGSGFLQAKAQGDQRRLDEQRVAQQGLQFQQDLAERRAEREARDRREETRLSRESENQAASLKLQGDLEAGRFARDEARDLRGEEQFRQTEERLKGESYDRRVEQQQGRLYRSEERAQDIAARETERTQEHAYQLDLANLQASIIPAVDAKRLEIQQGQLDAAKVQAVMPLAQQYIDFSLRQKLADHEAKGKLGMQQTLDRMHAKESFAHALLTANPEMSPADISKKSNELYAGIVNKLSERTADKIQAGQTSDPVGTVAFAGILSALTNPSDPDAAKKAMAAIALLHSEDALGPIGGAESRPGGSESRPAGGLGAESRPGRGLGRDVPPPDEEPGQSYEQVRGLPGNVTKKDFLRATDKAGLPEDVGFDEAMQFQEFARNVSPDVVKTKAGYVALPDNNALPDNQRTLGVAFDQLVRTSANVDSIIEKAPKGLARAEDARSTRERIEEELSRVKNLVIAKAASLSQDEPRTRTSLAHKGGVPTLTREAGGRYDESLTSDERRVLRALEELKIQL